MNACGERPGRAALRRSSCSAFILHPSAFILTPMGISDRDYHRGPAAGEVWYLKWRSLTAGLMAAQLLLFLVNARLAASRLHDEMDWLLDRPAPTRPAAGRAPARWSWPPWCCRRAAGARSRGWTTPSC